MARKAPAILGRTCASLGFVALVLGMARAPVPPIFGAPGWLVFAAAGGALLGAGLIAWVLGAREEPQAGPAVSATEAFGRRMAAPTEEIVARQAAPARTARVAAAPSERARLDEQIRDLSRRINRAGVMLATGQLSQEGYARYVEDLKRERAQLEASRVRMELSDKA